MKWPIADRRVPSTGRRQATLAFLGAGSVFRLVTRLKKKIIEKGENLANLEPEDFHVLSSVLQKHYRNCPRIACLMA